MTFPPGQCSTPSPPPAESWSNSARFELGLLLGEIRNEGRRHSEILLSVLDEVRDLPGRLEEAMQSHAERPQPPPPRAPAAPEPRPAFKDWADLLKAAWPLALIAAVVAGKLTAPDAIPLIRHLLLGGP